MSVAITCVCGQALRVRDDLAGKRIKCPRCGMVLVCAAAPGADGKRNEKKPAAPSPVPTVRSHEATAKGQKNQRKWLLATGVILLLGMVAGVVYGLRAPRQMATANVVGARVARVPSVNAGELGTPSGDGSLAEARRAEPATGARVSGSEASPPPEPNYEMSADVEVDVPAGGTGLILPAGKRTAAGTKANPTAPAVFTVKNQVLRPKQKVPPLGVGGWGGCGSVEWAANNFVRNSGNEPIYWRNLHRVKNCGPNWFEIDGPGTSWYELWGSGFLSGARLRIYRLVDRRGEPLPIRKDYLNLDLADHVQWVGTTTVVPEGSPGYPDGGWIVSTLVAPTPNSWIRHGNLSVTDFTGLENGRKYWYGVTAATASGLESDLSSEVSATPEAGIDTPPHVLIHKGQDEMPPLLRGRWVDFQPKVLGGQAPYRWALFDTEGRPFALPKGLRFEPATGQLNGTSAVDVGELRLQFQVTDARGRSDMRTCTFNPPARAAGATPKPQPPASVKAVAGAGCVTITWQPSASPGVVSYRLKRSTAPPAERMQRVYVSSGSPKLEPWDYVVIDRRFDNSFDMKYVSPRVRSAGNPMYAPLWYWDGDLDQLSFSLVPHPQPLPVDLIDPGETCMQVKVAAGKQKMWQGMFVGTDYGAESIYYGQLEPGKRYRVEVWLRQEGLANQGAVDFSYTKGYPNIQHTFTVTGEWRKYTFDFTGPPRPAKMQHFGHMFAFTGPGTLWMDNCRVYRVDRPEDADRPYVPNATVLDELVASQPASGPKGAPHRCPFLTRDATMSSLLSWHANSRVGVDWYTKVGCSNEMTVPMGLTFDLHTGDSPQTRMRPWLLMQHLLHDEQDWLNFIEYLAAPFDPQQDTPQAKPWAYRRYQQRGIGTPWTDEFASIVVELGNETWHNGIFDDWVGFSKRYSVHFGGPEYGFFARYLIGIMKRSPYWKPQHLDRKVLFTLGANYDGRVAPNGKVSGYGEEAMQSCGMATLLGHANYVGPKWETGDKSTSVFDDHGIQETLLAFLTGPQEAQVRMMEARNALARTHIRYDLAAYEGGPSGYTLNRDKQHEVNEQYGKSLAMGVAALDAWMSSYAYGWTDQLYSAYAQGENWTSHTPMWDGFRPCPAWQALALRNHHASGDLMAVAEGTVPTLERRTGKTTEHYPLVGAYALRDGKRWSLILLSRKVDGRHDVVDLGDGYTPVTLHLPFSKARNITLHTLSGDPRVSNRNGMNIKPETKTIDAGTLTAGKFVINERTGGGAMGLPPGSIFLYVFEESSASTP